METILEQECSKEHLSFVQNNEDYNFVPESWQHINSLNIKRITFLKSNFYMKYILMPFVYVLTLGLAPLFLYWYTNLYVYCLFDQMTQAKFDSKIQKVLEKKKIIDQIIVVGYICFRGSQNKLIKFNNTRV